MDITSVVSENSGVAFQYNNEFFDVRNQHKSLWFALIYYFGIFGPLAVQYKSKFGVKLIKTSPKRITFHSEPIFIIEDRLPIQTRTLYWLSLNRLVSS